MRMSPVRILADFRGVRCAVGVLVLVANADLIAQSNSVPGLDAKVHGLSGLTYFGRTGAAFPNGTAGFSFGHSVCNAGSVDIPWVGGGASLSTDNCPRTAFLIAREVSGRMVQISGASFVSHFPTALNLSTGPCAPCLGTTGGLLVTGCSNTQPASSNSNRLYLGPATEVDPWLGTWQPIGSYFDLGDPQLGSPDGARSLNSTQVAAFDPVKNRVAVRESELVVGGTLYAETHVVVAGEAVANRGDNVMTNQVTATWTGATWSAATVGAPSPGSVLHRWNGAYVASGANGTSDGRFEVAVTATDMGTGMWHYEYAVHNLDNSRGGASLRLPVTSSAVITNVGFRDIDSNPLNDWTFTRVSNEAVFTAGATNPLVWNTIYNFWFDCSSPPAIGTVQIDEALVGPGAFSVAVNSRVPRPAPVVINEFSHDDTGTDDREFVELYNRSGAALDISGFQLRFETAATSGILATVPATTILPPNGRWLIAQPFWSARNQALLANLPDSTAALVLRDPGGYQVDAVSYEGYAGTWSGAPVEGAPLFPEFLSNDGLDTSWSRTRDGHDTDRNSRDFRIARATPGTTNDRAALAPYTQNADGLAIGASIPGWLGSQGAPTVVSAAATAIGAGIFLPPSPQSPAANDRCIACQPGANNGRSYWIEADVSDSLMFDTYVWVDAQALPPGARHAWSIGIRGGTGSPYAIPDLPTSTPTDSNGDRGLTWSYLSTSTGHTLYLVDHGDGGKDHAVLATIPVTTSSWLRLKLGVAGTQLEARLGGTVGTSSGTLYRRSVHLGEGDIFVGVANTGSATLAMFMDGQRGQDSHDNQSANGGSGCQGNCLETNGKVKTLDRALGEEVPEGTYALKIDPGGLVTFSHVCFFTAQKGLVAPAATVQLYTNNNGSPGSPFGTSAALALHASDSGNGTWWAAPVGATVSSTFFVALTFDSQLLTPLAAVEADENGTKTFDPKIVPYWQTSGSAWTLAGTKPWAVSFVCTDKAGIIDSFTTSDAVPGNTLQVEVMGAGDSLPVFGVLGFQPTSLDLGFAGAPGCLLLVDPTGWLTFVALADTLGNTSWPISIPNNAALVGAQGHFQFVGTDASLNALGIATSDRLTVTIQ